MFQILKTGLFVLLLFCSCSFVRLSSFEASECISNCNHGVISSSRNKNILNVKYGAGSYCGLKFRGKIKFRNDTLFLTSIYYTEPARCFCSYELTYNIKGLDKNDYPIKYKGIPSNKIQKDHERTIKLNALRTSNPTKYKKISKRINNKFERKINREDQRYYRKKLRENYQKNDNDDVYK